MTSTRLITLNSTSARRTTVLHSAAHGTIYALDGLAVRPMNYCTTCGVNGGTLCSGKRGGYLAHPHPVRVLEVLGEAHVGREPEVAAQPATLEQTLEQILARYSAALDEHGGYGRECTCGRSFRTSQARGLHVSAARKRASRAYDAAAALALHVKGQQTAAVEANDLEPVEAAFDHEAYHAEQMRTAAAAGEAYRARTAERPVEPVMLAAGDLVRGAVVLKADGSRWFEVARIAGPITLGDGRIGVRVWPAVGDLALGERLDLDAALRVPVDAASVD